METTHVHIGPCPAEEEAAQIGELDFHTKNIKECQAFRNQILRQFGITPIGVEVFTQVNNHEFGQYREVVIYVDNPDDNPDRLLWALAVEELVSTTWDDEAKKELGL